MSCLGWEYAVEATHGGYGPVERRYHMSRRRRWVRTRHLVKPPDAVTVQVRLFRDFLLVIRTDCACFMTVGKTVYGVVQCPPLQSRKMIDA